MYAARALNPSQSTHTFGRRARLEYSSTKHILDEIDALVAVHYGFTKDELDFITNYDIKYRIGGADDEDEDN